MTVTVAPSPPFSLDDSVTVSEPVVIFDNEFGIPLRGTGARRHSLPPVAIAQVAGTIVLP